jgi:hypothetical protein
LARAGNKPDSLSRSLRTTIGGMMSIVNIITCISAVVSARFLWDNGYLM